MIIMNKIKSILKQNYNNNIHIIRISSGSKINIINNKMVLLKKNILAIL